jgi:hypothetical protein
MHIFPIRVRNHLRVDLASSTFDTMLIRRPTPCISRTAQKTSAKPALRHIHHPIDLRHSRSVFTGEWYFWFAVRVKSTTMFLIIVSVHRHRHGGLNQIREVVAYGIDTGLEKQSLKTRIRPIIPR